MASVNKVIILGNCGRDPEIRYLQSGKAVCNLSIATTSKRKDPQTGDVVEDTQWHRVTLYERLAEIVGEYVKKGSPVYIEGRLKYGKYTDQAGVEKNTCDIIATELQLLGSRDQAGGQGGQGGQQQAPRQAAAPQQAPRQAAPQQRQQAPQQRQAPQHSGGGGGFSSGFDDMDDDIPFVSTVSVFDTESRLDRRVRRSRV